MKSIRQAVKGLGVGGAALALIAGGALLAGGAAVAAGTVTSGDIADQTIQSRDIGPAGVGTSELRNNDVRRGDIKDGAVGPGEILDGSVRIADMDPAAVEELQTGEQGPAGPAGPQGPEGPQGPAGPAGEGGADAIVTVNAMTAVSDRNDSAVGGGSWAKDTFTRDVTVTRQHAAKAADCGGGATQCWFYTANLVDAGTFMTIEGATSPQEGVEIAGIVSGTFNGGSRIEFYASSDSPDASLVPATVTGNDLATGDWVKEFFADGTVVTAPDLLNWSWTYTAPATCEQWVNAKAGNTGDIAGVNQCGTGTTE